MPNDCFIRNFVKPDGKQEKVGILYFLENQRRSPQKGKPMGSHLHLQVMMSQSLCSRQKLVVGEREREMILRTAIEM